MNIFQYVRPPKRRFHTFNLTHENKLTANFGNLYPVLVEHVFPSDSGKISVEPFIRLAPALAPIMHSIDVTFDAFFVPYRILLNSAGQQELENFFTGGTDGTAVGSIPFIDLTSIQASISEGGTDILGPGSLLDFLGYQSVPNDDVSRPANIWAPMAYNKIYFDYYRDQNFGDADYIQEYAPREYVYDEISDQFVLHKRAWKHDYFTSALPWAQRGNDVKIPISAEVVNDSGYPVSVVNKGNYTNLGNETFGLTRLEVNGSAVTGGLHAESENDSDATTINDLRRAMALERWMEANARGGARLGEYNYSHFGVFPDDARLQRAQYLGRRVQPVKVSEVLQTSETTENSPLGDMGGHGISVGFHKPFKFHVKEAGVVMILMSILPKTGYCQGINRFNLKLDRFDYYSPEFAHLGEQPILKQELYSETSDWDGTFGYIPRYSEYKFHNSECHGEFKSSLAYWHLDRIFSTEPNLNDSFVKADPSYRVFAVTSEESDHFWCQIGVHEQLTRQMPVFGTPMI